MKALITGSSGFYGKHLSHEFEENGYEIIRCDLKPDKGTEFINILDYENVLNVLDKYKPDVLVNMAGQANVGLSWEKPQMTVQLNTVGFINIIEAVRAVNPSIKVVAIGSSDEYGILKELGNNVSEDMPINPITPYAVSKQAQEQFARLYVNNYGMNIYMVRQFNLAGPGQARGFMIADFSSGIVEIETGEKNALYVGNLESARDFTHVKDACRAIRLIVEKGHKGEIYNICSGKTYKAKYILDKLISLSESDIKIIQDPKRMRPSDTPVICGNHDKLTNHTGWTPEIDINQILSDSLNYWRAHKKP